MPYRNKTYVAFDGDRDIQYYYLMKAWRDQDNNSFNFHDAHDLNHSRDSSKKESIKVSLRERFRNSKTFIILVGQSTRYLRKFVKWEIEQAVQLALPIIVVNLNNSKSFDRERCPPLLFEELAIHIPFKKVVVQYALENWPGTHRKRKALEEKSPCFYVDRVYRKLGINE